MDIDGRRLLQGCPFIQKPKADRGTNRSTPSINPCPDSNPNLEAEVTSYIALHCVDQIEGNMGLTELAEMLTTNPSFQLNFSASKANESSICPN